MTETAKRKKKEKMFSIVLTVLIAAFLGLVFYINLSCNPEYYDGDIYNDINFAKEAWKAKSLFPANWVFGNQTYVVATPVLAALIYGVTGNAVTAMAIASCIMTVLTVLTYEWMTRTLFSYNERTAGFLFLIGFLLMKAHVATSQQGLQAFFTMASYYSCYLITAFIVFGCYVRIRQKNFCKKHIPMLVIGVALSFGTGMQSLRQTAVMALPLVVCELLLIIICSVRNKKVTLTSSSAFSVLILLSNVAGTVAVKFIEFSQNSIYGSTSFRTDPVDLLKNIMYNIEYAALAFGLDSLKLIPRLVASVPFLLIILVGTVLCVKDFFKNGCRDQGIFALVVLLILGCAGVFASGVLTELVGRALYYFMIYPLFSVCVSYILVKLGKRKNIAASAIAVFAAAMLVFRTAGTVGEVKKGKDENSTSHQIADYMLENGYDTVFSVFGLSGVIDGAENVIIASKDELHIVQYKRVDGRFALQPVEYLCVKDDYKSRDNAKSLYLLREYELDKVGEFAEKYGVTMTLKAQFGEVYLYSLSDNIVELVAENEETQK